MAESFDRFRSFAERYIIVRAANFRAGHEKEDAWLATQDAKTIYNNIEIASKDPNVCDNAVTHSGVQQSGALSSANHPGVTAAHGPASFPARPYTTREATPSPSILERLLRKDGSLRKG